MCVHSFLLGNFWTSKKTKIDISQSSSKCPFDKKRSWEGRKRRIWGTLRVRKVPERFENKQIMTQSSDFSYHRFETIEDFKPFSPGSQISATLCASVGNYDRKKVFFGRPQINSLGVHWSPLRLIMKFRFGLRVPKVHLNVAGLRRKVKSIHPQLASSTFCRKRTIEQPTPCDGDDRELLFE